LFATVLVGGMVGFSWYAYTDMKMLIDAVYPSLSGLILYMSLTYMNFIREEKQKKQVRGAFSMYMSPALVEKLADDPDLLKLGGEMKEMTLLFADIRGFTTISETYKEHPEALTEFINKFLTPMTGVILEREGTIDKYMGDCIMAFWNAPLDDAQHPTNACDSALAMLKACDDVGVIVKQQAEERAASARANIEHAKAKLGKGDTKAENEIQAAEQMLALAEQERDLSVKIGIGLNTDIVCVGNMGSDQRFDYSVLGDGVNLASRLEGQSKTYGVAIVLGEDTHNQAPDYACIELDLIQVKGQTRPTRIFGLLGNQQVASSSEFVKYKEKHDRLLLCYRSQQWDEASKLSSECWNLCGPWGNTGLYDLFDERIEEYKDSPPGDEEGNWDGVYVATSK
jgi:adenylate cyclase